MKKKYLIPPKLQQEFLLGGFSVLELMLAGGWLLLAVTTHHYVWLFGLAVAIPMFCRLDGERNAVYFLLLLIRFYGGKSQYTRRSLLR